MPQNIDIQDLIGATISVGGYPLAVVDPLDGQVLIAANELNALVSTDRNYDYGTLYSTIRSRLKRLRELISAGASVALTKADGTPLPALTIASVKELESLFFNTMSQDIINVDPLLQGSFRALIPQANKKPFFSVSTPISSLAEKAIRAESLAESNLIDDEEISLKIGYITFGKNELGPDSVVINDINEVSSACTVRSDTDVAVKSCHGRMGVEIDIIFHDTKSINDKFRRLLGMLRMAPIVPVGGSAISAALLNRISSSKLYQELKSKFFNDSLRSDPYLNTNFTEFTEMLNHGEDIDKTKLIDFIGSERDAFKLVRQVAAYETEQKKKAADYEQSGYKIPAKDEIVDLDTYLIPLVIDDITVSTISSSAGAIRVRLSFIKSYNTYSPDGGLVFIDADGYPTYNIDKCLPLGMAVETIYLNPKRGQPQKDGSFKPHAVWNRNYIPSVGDKLVTVPGVGFQGIDITQIETSDVGHNLYKDPENIARSSPMLMQFNTPRNTLDYYTYVPSDLILQSVSWSQSNRVAEIPLEGTTYPTFQVMGKSLISASMTFSTSDERAVQRFMTVKGSMDQISSFNGGSSAIRREFCNVYNDILNLSGIKKYMISGVQLETAQDNPGLYYIHVTLISNEENLRDQESLEVREALTGTYKTAKKFWWWLYSGLLNKFSKTTGVAISDEVQGKAKELSNTPAGHTAEELDLIWGLVFGTVNSNSNTYEEGFMENNLFLAAFLQLILEGKVGTDRTLSTINGNPFQPEAGDDHNLGKYLKKVLTSSKLGAEANKTKVLDERFVYNNNHDAIKIDQIMEVVRDAYKFDPITPWWIAKSDVIIEEEPRSFLRKTAFALLGPEFVNDDYQTSYSDRFIRLITEALITGPNNKPYDTAVTKGVIQPNTSVAPFWVPSVAMWDAMFDAVMDPSKYRSDRDTSAFGYTPGYFLTEDVDDPAFYITPKWTGIKQDLNGLLSVEEFRLKFRSFWDKEKQTDNTPTNNSITPNAFDPTIYEYKNNYKDIPLPRYVELFGNRTDNSGYEIWRKVAPSYLELGIAPDVFLGLSTAFNATDQRMVTSPGFMTPRSLYDYCDPGFFYYKKSWLIDSYNQIIDQLNQEVDDGSLSVFGSNENPKVENAEDILKRQNQFQYGDAELVLGEADMGIVFEQVDPIRSEGVINLGDNKTKINLKQLANYIQRNIKEQSNASATATSREAAYIERLKNNEIKHIRIVVGGKQVGALVSSRHGRVSNDAKTITYAFDSGNGERAIKGVKVDIPTPNNDPKNESGLYFLDLTNFFPENPNNVTYKDASGVLQYNLYKKEQSKQTLKNILDNLGDLRNNYLRAYPTFKLYFVKERVIDGNTYEEFLEDDMYGYSSVIDLSITIDKEDAATAIVKVTDITGTLSTSVYKREIVDTTKEYDDDIDKGLNGDTPARIKLEIGTNIVIKMGYGHDPDTLKTVFTGSIAEIEPGEITTIIAQSYRTELYRYVNDYSSTGIFDGLVDRFILKRNVNPVHPEYLIHKTLVKLAQQEGVDEAFSLSGLPHFGRFINRGIFTSLSKEEQDELRTKFQDVQNNLLRPSWSTDKLSAVIVNTVDTFANWIAKYNVNNVHTNAMRNVFLSDDPIADGWWDLLSDEWVINSSGWQALKEITRYKVGYICQELPYGNRATLFIGKPDQLYHYKPVSNKTLSRYEKAYPAIALGSFKVIYDNLISRFLSSDEYSNDNFREAIAKYKLDYRDADTTDLSIDALVEYLTARITSKGTTVSPPVIAEVFQPVTDPGGLKSYKFAAAVINPLKSRFGINSTAVEPNINTKAFVYKERVDEGDGNPIPKLLSTNFNINVRDLSSEVIFVNRNIKIDQYTANGRRVENGILVRSISSLTSIFDLKSFPTIGSGLVENQVLAVSDKGRLVGAEELKTRFKIDPSTGVPLGVSQANNIIDNYNIIVASDIGFTAISSKPNSNNKPLFSNNLPGTSYKVNNLLVYDNSKYLDDIRSYGGDLLKLIFCLYYGIGFKKTGDGTTTKIDIASTDTNVEQLIDAYANAIMRGIGTVKSKDNSLTDSDAIAKYQTILISLLDQLNTKDRSDIKYGDLKSNLSLTEADRQSAIAQTDGQLRDLLLSGQLQEDQYKKAKETLQGIIGSTANIDVTSIIRLSNKFNDGDSFKNILLNMSDDFKLVLIFFSKFLRNNKSNLTTQLQSANAMSDLLSVQSLPGTKVFRDIHHISTGSDIMENNITATMSHMANNILLLTPREIKLREEGENGVTIKVVDEEKTSWIPYPNYQTSGVDFNPYVSPELRKQRQVKERNAETDTMRSALLINHMAEAVRPMYRGHLKIMGRAVKPYDLIVLADSYKDMFGVIEVERVVHTFNVNDGWVTTIIPHALVNPLDEAAEVAARFCTRHIDWIYRGITAMEWVADATLIYGLLAMPKQAIVAGAKTAANKAAQTGATKITVNNFKNRVNTYVGEVVSQVAARQYRVQAEQELVASGVVVTADLINKKALEIAASKGLTSNIGQFLYGSVAQAAKRITGSAGTWYLGSTALLSASRTGMGMLFNMQTDWMLTSSTLPIHVFTLTRMGRPFQAGLDMRYQRFFNASERFGYALDQLYRNSSESIREALTFTDGANSANSRAIKNILNR